MTPLPTSNQIQAFLKEARDELDVIEQFHRPALRIARDHEISLKAGGGDGRASKGDHSDPTAAQATGTHDTSTQWARGLHDGYANGLTVLHSFAAVCLEAGKAGKAQARTQAKCANPFGCPDDAHAQSGRQGRCYSCWRFWRTHDSRDRNDRYHRTGLTPSSVPTPDLDEAEAVPIDAALPRRTVRDPKAKKAKRTKIRKARTAEERVARLREHMGHT